jgi:predicted N-acetyltransferase YhbS
MDVVIREATKEEIPKVVEVTNEAFNVPYDETGIYLPYNESSEKLISEFADGTTKVLVALMDGEIIGAVRYGVAGANFTPFHEEKEVSSLELKKLAVLEQFREQKVGEKLLREVERIAQEEGRPAVVLECMEEKNLVPYYKKFGYEEFRTLENKERHDVYMVKKLIF